MISGLNISLLNTAKQLGLFLPAIILATLVLNYSRGISLSDAAYIDVVGKGVDKLKSGDPLVTANHPDILRMFAVRHTDAVGLTLGQGILISLAVDIVKPDTT